MSKEIRFHVLLAALILLALPIWILLRSGKSTPVSSAETIAIPSLGIHGTVRLAGTPPPERPLPLDPNCAAAYAEKFPGAAPRTRFYVRNAEGGLADVLVSLEGPSPSTNGLGAARVLIEQRGCRSVPQVVACLVNQEVSFLNLDPVLHNLHVMPTNRLNPEYNKAQLPAGPPLSFRFRAPEFFLRIKCDVHPWMFTYVNVMPHEYHAITDSEGRFSIPQPPPGKYRMRVQHRKLPPAYRDIVVNPGRGLSENFTLSMKR